MTQKVSAIVSLLPLTSEDPPQIGPYRLVGRLGAGGMGVVFAGIDARGVRAAVKLVHASYASDLEFRARFAREIAVLGRVKGVCTARILDSDGNAARPWLAAEYVPGPSLEAQVRAHGLLQGDQLFGLAAGIAEALVAVHAAGVVHRDLKPSNVILSPSGPKLVDFGIARVLDASVMTRTGILVGSPGWVSPEEYGDVPAGPSADVYGWAMLVVYAATGVPPYGTGRPEVLALKVLNETVDTSMVPYGLRGLVDRALAKTPKTRLSSPELLGAVAEAWRTHQGTRVINSVGAADEVTARLDRTWIFPVEDQSWPAAQAPTTTAPKGRRNITIVATAAAVAAALGAAVALNVLSDNENQRKQRAETTAIQTGRPSSTSTNPTSTPVATPVVKTQPPPSTTAELAAAIELALETTPAGTFRFEGGFTQSAAGGMATGRFMSHLTDDDLDVRIRTSEDGSHRYVVVADTVYPQQGGTDGSSIDGMSPADPNWYGLLVAGTAGPSILLEVVANSTRLKRKGRNYSGTLAVEDTNGPLRQLLNSWSDGDVAETMPDSYITFKLTIDGEDRPQKFEIAWCVPISDVEIYRSVFTTTYSKWTSSHKITEP
ncbi:serine/threonine protein kinase [Acrocarpospora catenulata]|uniref:serine/threonine protein kinase n=1 Tax=Acrocarpospora catenulata TaxID=2836182 RepID=UPI001BDA6E45|nr:serine/threonine-protein kinase [Acrocarpospora catenulata]